MDKSISSSASIDNAHITAIAGMVMIVASLVAWGLVAYEVLEDYQFRHLQETLDNIHRQRSTRSTNKTT